MLRLLADENIPKRLVALLRRYSVDVTRLQDLGARGISDRELVDLANRLGRTILTRDADFTLPSLLSLAMYGEIYIAYQPRRSDVHRLAERIASVVNRLEPKPGLLIVVEPEYVEIHE